MEHPFRGQVGKCCAWHSGRYKYQAVVTPCSMQCLAALVVSRERLTFDVVKDELGAYLRDSKVTLHSLVVDAESFVNHRIFGVTWVPDWAKVLLAFGSRMRSKHVPRPPVNWPRFLSQCGADPQLREAMVAAVQSGAEPAHVRNLVAEVAPKLLSLPHE